jgi:thioredoxin
MGSLGETLRRGLRARGGIARLGVSGVDMASENVKTFTDSNFDEETKQGVVLVDFWAEWCGPCRRIAPIVEQLATEYAGRATIGKMNVDENPNVPASRFHVRGIPTLVVLKNGQLVDTIVGAVPREDIVSAIERHLG